MVSSSYGLSNFKLRGVFFVVASVSSAVPLEQKNIQNSSQTNKQKQKKKVAHRKGGGRSPRASTAEELRFPPRSPASLSPALQLGSAGTGWSSTRCVRFSRGEAGVIQRVPGCGAATHVLFGVLEMGRKKERTRKRRSSVK